MADQDYKDLIDTLIAEVGGEPRASQIAAAYAIANRAAKQGKSVGEIVRAPKQFSGYAKPGAKAKQDQQNPKVRARLESVWRDVETRKVPDPLRGGTMFHASNIDPYWSKAENKHGTKVIGGHTYYLGASALPPDNVPKVATALDAIERVAPVASPNLPSMRSAYAAALPEIPRARPATPAPRSTGRVADLAQSVPSSIIPSLDAGRYTGPMLDAAYARNDDPNYINSGAKPYRQPVVSASDLARGKTPSKFAEMPVGLPQVLPGVSSWDEFYKGITPAAKVAAPGAPTPATADERVTARNAALVRNNPLPAAPAPRPQTDATIARAFASALPPIAAQQAAQKEAARIAAPMPKIATFQPVAPTPSAGPGYNAVSAAQRNALSALPSPVIAQPNVAPKSQTRLRTAEAAPPKNNSVAPLYNPAHPLVRDFAPKVLPLDMPPTVASVPLPRTRPAAPAIPASLTQVASVPAPMPTMPRAPMGGPTNLAPTNLGPVKNFLGIPNAVPKDFAVAPNAPLPTPRIERGGIFGKPQIFGMDIPLPGVFGVLQNATRAMNNASGPFNNGLDNSLYMGLRGGNFTAPGAATAKAGGFIYAPSANGWVNVGRDPNAQASTFSAGRPNALDRMNAGRDDSGASASSIYG